jgi:hypothetical protein
MNAPGTLSGLKALLVVNLLAVPATSLPKPGIFDWNKAKHVSVQ